MVSSSDESYTAGSDKKHVSNKYRYCDNTDLDSDSLSSFGSTLNSSSMSSLSEAETNNPNVTENKEMKKGELGLEDLPKIEDLNIKVPKSEIEKIGSVSSIIEQLVIVESFKNSRLLDVDSVLFFASGKPLGRVFKVFGLGVNKMYAVRFNSWKEIEEKGIYKNDPVYFAPKHKLTHIYIESLQKEKESDASWSDDNDPSIACLDYSDDEQERNVRLKQRAKNRRRSIDENDAEENRKVACECHSQYVQNVRQNYNANPQQSTTIFPSTPVGSNYFQKSLPLPIFHSSQLISTPPKPSSVSLVPGGLVQINASPTSTSHSSSLVTNQCGYSSALPQPVFRTLPPPVLRPLLSPSPQFIAFPRVFSTAGHQNHFPVPAFPNTVRHILAQPALAIFKPPPFNQVPPPALINALRQVLLPNTPATCLSSGLRQTTSAGPRPNIPLTPGFSGFPRAPVPSGTSVNSSPPQAQNTDSRTLVAPVVNGFPGQSPSLNPVHQCFSSPPQRTPAVSMPCQQFRTSPPSPMSFQSPTSSECMTGSMCQQLPPPQPSVLQPISQAQIDRNRSFLNALSQQNYGK